VALSDLQNAANLYEQALAADAVSPQPSYALDGQSVSRNEWRAGLMKMIIDLNKTINALNPYVISTRNVL
jgi:hypothetical protein